MFYAAVAVGSGRRQRRRRGASAARGPALPGGHRHGRLRRRPGRVRRRGRMALVAIAALVVAGFATDFYEVVGLTYFQGAIPDAVYGRFFSVFLLALERRRLGGGARRSGRWRAGVGNGGLAGRSGGASAGAGALSCLSCRGRGASTTQRSAAEPGEDRQQQRRGNFHALETRRSPHRTRVPLRPEPAPARRRASLRRRPCRQAQRSGRGRLVEQCPRSADRTALPRPCRSSASASSTDIAADRPAPRSSRRTHRPRR